MPSFTSIALLSLYILTTLAAPFQKRDDNSWSNQRCLSASEAQQVATNYGTLIATYTDALAEVALAENFTDYSESVNTLINGCPQGSAAQTLPLLAATFSNLTQFEIGQGQQPPINFEQLDIWQGCTSVTIRWETTNTAPIPDPKPVMGLIVMETVPAPAGNPYPYLIDTVYSEFDAGAWLENLQAAGICSQSQSGGSSSSSAAPAGSSAPAAGGAPPAASMSSPSQPAQTTGPGGYVAAGMGMASTSTIPAQSSSIAISHTSSTAAPASTTHSGQSWTSSGSNWNATGAHSWDSWTKPAGTWVAQPTGH